jgi:hypothetical protein
MSTTILRASAAALTAAFLVGSPAGADDAEIAGALRNKGAKVAEARGVVTSVQVEDCKRLVEEDYRAIGKLNGVKMLTFGAGLTEKSLAVFAGLPEVNYIQTNLLQFTDDGARTFAKFPKLRTLKLFHPDKAFTGSGLAHLAELSSLEQLTVAGSFGFNDEGMAAVAKIKGLKEFRSWHCGQTDEGLKKIRDMPNLKALYLGQRLTYKPPAFPSDESLAVLAEMKPLESLQLDEARFSLEALRKLKRLPALKKLTLGGVDISEADVEQLRKDLPGVDVKWTAPNDVYRKRINALFGAK